MKNSRPLAAFVFAALACVGAASAQQFRGTDDAIEYRQGALAVMAHHFGRIGEMVDGKAPFDAREAQANAELVATLARLPWSAFVEGSDKGDTNARPEVWTQRDRFDIAAQRLQDASARLVDATKTGKPESVKAAFGEAAAACKGCHDEFRKKH